MESAFSPERLKGAFEVGHKRVGVYDSGGEGLEDPGCGPHVGLAVAGLLEWDEARGDGDGAREFVDFGYFLPLFLVLGYDPLLRVAVGDVLFGAEGVHHFFAFETESRFERVVPVVEAGVDDLVLVSGSDS